MATMELLRHLSRWPAGLVSRFCLRYAPSGAILTCREKKTCSGSRAGGALTVEKRG